MRELFYRGGIEFMTFLTILLVVATGWIIYHFIRVYISKDTKQEKLLRRIGYGKTIGLFALIVGLIGQMLGLYAMFYAVQDMTTLGFEVKPEKSMEGIKVTMIVTLYGVLIYLFTLLLCFIAKRLIKKKVASTNSA
jgi:biopolymer transport protein ExbB/TolQ